MNPAPMIFGAFGPAIAAAVVAFVTGDAWCWLSVPLFIAVGAQMISMFSWTFLLFGAILLATAVKVLKDALSHEDEAVDVGSLRSVKLIRRFFPVTEDYRGPALTVKEAGKRALTPLGLVAIAILGTDVVFAVDSVPAVFGITGDAYLVDGDGYIGRVSVRHVLNDTLRVFGGHIGYDVRPSRRRQGFGTKMLRMVLPFAKSIGIDPAMLTCDVTNTASRRMIEACGGRIECEFAYEGTQRLRWWLPTS